MREFFICLCQVGSTFKNTHSFLIEPIFKCSILFAGMKNIFPYLCISLTLLLFSLGTKAQTNDLLDREFWKRKPSLEQVQNKVNQGHDPSELNRNAFDPLIYALLEKAPMETLLFLYNQEGNEVNKLTHDGRTYIFWAAYKNHLAFVKHLVADGADTDIIDDHGYSVLNFAANTGVQNPELYDFLIAHGTEVTAEKNLDGANALLLLLPYLDEPKMVDYFTKKGLSIYDKDAVGNTSFNYAAGGGNIQMLTWLAEKGVQQKAVSTEGRNAVHFASKGIRGHKNSIAVFEFLQGLGIDPTKTDTQGITPFMIYVADPAGIETIEWFLANGASPDKADKEGNTALMKAAKYAELETVELLLKTSKDVNASNLKGQTALTYAVSRNSAEVVEALLKAGASASVKDARGNNLVYYLVASFQESKADEFDRKTQVLRNSGLNLASKQGDGSNFFHLAADKNEMALLKIAATLGVDVNAINDDGLTALHIAAMKTENMATLKYLVSVGADTQLHTLFGESAYQLARENELLRDNKTDMSFLQN